MFSVFWVLVNCLVAFVLYKIFVRPLSYIWPYIKSGEAFYFFPIMGIFFRNHLDVKAKGQFYAYVVEKCRENPAPRLIATNIGSSAMIILLDTKLVKAFYAHNDFYRKKLEIYGFLPDLLGQGLITANGATHKRHRKITSRAFHWEFLISSVPMIVKTTKEVFDRMEAKGELRNVKVLEISQSITGVVVGRIFFGEEMNNYKFRGLPLTEALNLLLQRVGVVGLSGYSFLLGDKVLKKIPIGPHVKVIKDITEFRNLCVEIVQGKKKHFREHKLAGDTNSDKAWKDMLDVLFDHVEKNASEDHFSDKDIVDEFITFFSAGMDTTAQLVSLGLYYLTLHPKYLARVMEEVDRLYKDGENLTIDNIQKMDFIMAFLKETLRVGNPAPLLFPREAMQDHYLEDVKIRKGAMVTVGIVGNHLSDSYFKDSANFYPERWFEDSQLKDAYAYIPFSGGPRNCIGQHLSLIEAKIMMCEFVRRYHFKMRENYQLRMTVRFMHEPEDQLEMNLIKKECDSPHSY